MWESMSSPCTPHDSQGRPFQLASKPNSLSLCLPFTPAPQPQADGPWSQSITTTSSRHPSISNGSSESSSLILDSKNRLLDLRSKPRTSPNLGGIRDYLLNSMKQEADVGWEKPGLILRPQGGPRLWHRILGWLWSYKILGPLWRPSRMSLLECWLPWTLFQIPSQEWQTQGLPTRRPRHTHHCRAGVFTLLTSYHGLSTLVPLYQSHQPPALHDMGLWPVRNWVTQEEVSGGWASKSSSLFTVTPHRSHYLLSSALSDQRRH